MKRRLMVWAPIVGLIMSALVAFGAPQTAGAATSVSQSAAVTNTVSSSEVQQRQLRYVKVWLKRKLVVRHGHVVRKAIVAFKNTSRYTLEIDCGGPHKVPMQKFAAPGQVVNFKTGRRVLYFLMNGAPAFDNGKIYTQSGRVVSPIA